MFEAERLDRTHPNCDFAHEDRCPEIEPAWLMGGLLPKC
jgi:hypothetical protein